jgi:hypothetical protein
LKASIRFFSTHTIRLNFLGVILCSGTFTAGIEAQQLSQHDTIKVIATSVSDPFETASVGMGLGLDMGGIGANIIVYPIHHLGLFAGLGYAFAGAGVNAGLKVRLVSANSNPKVIPYWIAMYGYNTALIVENRTELSKLFYGGTLGLGIDINQRPQQKFFISISLLVPIRNKETREEYANDNYINIKHDPFPLAGSIGIRFAVQK